MEKKIYARHKIDMKNNSYHVVGNGWKIKTKKAVEEMLKVGGLVIVKDKKTGLTYNLMVGVVK